MDIMNNMTVSKSKLTFSLIAITALLVSGSAFLDQEAFGAATTFVAIHNSTTQTEIIFSQPINGTLNNQNWFVGLVMATAASNGTVPSAAGNNYASTTDGFLNNTSRIVLTHAALNGTGAGAIADVRYVTSGMVAQLDGTTLNADIAAANVGNLGRGGYGYAGDASVQQQAYNILANNTVAVEVHDAIAPTLDSAQTIGDRTIELTFSEGMNDYNATAGLFSLTGTDQQPAVLTFSTNGSSVGYLKLANDIDWRDTFTLDFTLSATQFLTDSADSPLYGTESHNGTSFLENMLGSATKYYTFNGVTDRHVYIGTPLASFSGLLLTNNVDYVSPDSCFDCMAPTITNVEISVPSSNTVTVSADDPVHVTAEVGDTITIAVTYDDNKGAANIPYSGIYTNFVDTPEISNLYYKNNFDGLLQMSTSYYEWNARVDDVVFDNDGALTWDVASSETDSDTQRKTLTYTFTINDDFESSQVWIDTADANGNYLKTSLPITIEVAGDPSLTFASNGNQKVTSFFNESILFAIVSQWNTSSDNTANTAELSSILGINDSALPEWTTTLATWAADDKIDIADMVIAVEYVINT
jgi:hypothetical protein